MATRLYLSSDDTQYTPPTNKAGWEGTGSSVVQRLSRRRSGIATDIAIPENDASPTFDRLLGKWISDPLAAQTISGTVAFMLLMAESLAAGDLFPHIHAYVTQGDTDSVRGTLIANYIGAAELAVNASNHEIVSLPSVALTSVTAVAGDRLVVEIGYRATNTVTTGYTGKLKFGGTTSDAVGTETNVTGTSNTTATWLEFSGDLAFKWSYLYLQNAAAPVTPGATRGTWDDASSPIDAMLGAAPAGIRATASKSETSATQFDQLVARFVSDELSAQTINTPVRLLSGLREFSADADAFAKYHLYVMAPDGSVRGTLLSNQVATAELAGSTVALDTERASTSVAASAGDRLVLEIGARFTNTLTASKTVDLFYGGPTAEFSVGALSAISNTGMSPYLRFGQVLAFGGGSSPPAARRRSPVQIG